MGEGLQKEQVFLAILVEYDQRRKPKDKAL
jgi:hypothetical protein